MIKLKNGTLEIEGSKSQIKAELIGIMHEMMEEKMLTEEELRHCIEMAKMSEKDISEKVADAFIDLLKKVFGDTEEKND